ncbi:hypothetical protein [Prosthecobacter sp.]|uniref:hypothetical protein n=1 Tax=Prosthecobacter sp. TaxID=1965333 RepID=UPI002AB870C8|nr:hypothetical protein [Prosthecobacter sp.]MDZ4401292.1 hypothetical protein [Prosthecobacter sp.]
MKFEPTMYTERCPVCQLPSVNAFKGAHFEVDCVSCGPFTITKEAQIVLGQGKLSPEQKANASWFLRLNPEHSLDTQNLAMLNRARGLDVNEKGTALLLALSKRYPRAGDLILYNSLVVLPKLFKFRDAQEGGYPQNLLTKDSLSPFEFLAICACRDALELNWVLQNWLLKCGYLEPGPADAFLQISLEGWRLIAEMQKVGVESRSAFIAMPFAPRFTPLFELALYPGIERAGYTPVRIDRAEHNNRIDDEIIAAIRRSRFVVADLSLHRGGIYFEAGYALGLGLPVVWTVEQSALDNNEVHFDNRQYNFLVWKEGGYDDLAKRLSNRIEATIGRPR